MKQHFVPEVYLRGFSNRTGDLFYLNIAGLKKGHRRKPRQTNISKNCYGKDYYTIDPAAANRSFPLGGFDELFIESKILHEKEERYSEIRDRLIRQSLLSFDDFIFFSDFIIQLKLRNPFWKINILEKNKSELLDEVISNLASEIHSLPQFQNVPSGIKQLLVNSLALSHTENNDWSGDFQKRSLIDRYNPNMLQNLVIRGRLLSGRWYILEIPLNSHTYFITSDNLGFSVDDEGNYYNTGWGKKFSFFLPLNYRYCLHIKAHDLSSNSLDNQFLYSEKKLVPEQIVKIINTYTAEVINEKIFSIRDKEILSASETFQKNIHSNYLSYDLINSCCQGISLSQ